MGVVSSPFLPYCLQPHIRVITESVPRPLRTPTKDRIKTPADLRVALEALLRKGLIIGQFDEAAQQYRFVPTGRPEGRAA